MDQMRVDLVNEAERIVRAKSKETVTTMPCAFAESGCDSRRAEPRGLRLRKKADAEFDVLLNVVMVLSCITLAAVLTLNLL